MATTRRRIFEIGAATLGLVVAAGVIAWLVLALVATRRLDAAKARWEADIGPLRAPPPALTEESATAQRLDAIARDLGYWLTLKAPSDVPAGAPTPHQLGVRAYVDSQIAATSSSVVGPTGELREWLVRHQATVRRLVDVVQAGPPPRWVQVTPGPDPLTPTPNMLGHFWISHVLLMASFDAEARGDHAEALRTLDAAWKLTESLAEQRMLLATIIATSAQTKEAAAARRLRDASEEWIARLEADDSGRRLVEALSAEGQVILWPVESPARWADAFRELDAKRGTHDADSRLLWPIALPWRRLAVADQLDSGRELIVSVRERPSCLDEAAAAATESRLGARWPRRDDLPGGGIGAIVCRRATELRYQADLSLRALHARRDALDGRLQEATLDGSCPGWSWNVRRLETGFLEVSFAGTPPWSPTEHAHYPDTYRERMAPALATSSSR